MNRIISLILITALLLSIIPVTVSAEDLSLAVRIENLQKSNEDLKTEKNGLNEKFIKLLQDQPIINQSIYQLRRNAGGNAIVLTVRLIVESVGLITTDWKEIAQKYRDALTGDDENIYYIRSNEEYANALRGDLLLISDLETNLANNKNKLNQINARIAEIDNQISSNSNEISRLKELYKQSTGEEYGAAGSARKINTAPLDTQYNSPTYTGDAAVSGKSDSEGYGTAMAAALYGYQCEQQLKTYYINTLGYTLTSPELVWTNNLGDTLVYQSILCGKPWDGTYKDAIDRSDYANASRTLFTVARSSAGRFFLTGMQSELQYNTAPEININFNDCYLARGFKVQLHADTEDAEGDEVQITWFLETANGYQQIGQGNDYLWAVPADQTPGYIVAVAVDSKGGISYKRSNYNVNDTYSIYDVSFRTIPEALAAGSPAILVAELRTNQPGEFNVDWGYGPNYMNNPAYTVKTTDEAEFLSRNANGSYNYRSYIEFEPKAYTDSNELVYNYRVKAQVKAGAGGIIYNTSYEYSQDISLSEAHILQDQLNAQDAIIASINAKKLEYDALYKNYKDQLSSLGNYAFADPVDLYSLTVRSKQYADWRLGLAEADMAWGENYTYSLFKSESEECLTALKQMCQKLQLSYGTDLDTAMGEPASGNNWDDMFKYRLKVIASYIPQLKTLFDRQKSLYEAYTKASTARDALNDMARDIDKSKLAFNLDTLAWPSEAVYGVSSEAYTQLDNYLVMLNNDIARIPAQGNFNPVTQPVVQVAPSTPATTDEIKIEVNSSLVTGDVAPRIVNGRTMVPIRFVAQALNCLVDWRGSDNTVIITSNGASQVNPPVTDKNLKIYVDGKLVTSDVPPQIVDGRTLVPIRFVAQALNATVNWDNASRKVIITTN